MRNAKTILLWVLFGMFTGGTFMLVQAISGEPLVFPPNISIVFPVNNTIYSSTSLDLNWTSNETLDWCAYSLDGGANNTDICRGIDVLNLDIAPTATTDLRFPGEVQGQNFTIVNSDVKFIGIIAPYMHCGDSEVDNYTLSFYNQSNDLLGTSEGTIVTFPITDYINITFNPPIAVENNRKYYFTANANNTGDCPVTLVDRPSSYPDGSARSTQAYCAPDGNVCDMRVKIYSVVNRRNITLTSLSEEQHNITIYGENADGQQGQSSYVYFTVSLLPIVSTSINNTSPLINEIINITANITSASGLSFCQIIENQTSSNVIYNFSLSGTEDKCSQNITIGVAHAVINFTVRVNDTNNNFAMNDIIITVLNTLPIVTSATINNSAPANAEDLQCNNGSVSDVDSDVVTLMYNWTKDGIDQAISTKELSNALTSVADIWQCKITPFDGYENGSTVASATVSIGTGNIPPIINWTNSTPLIAELMKGQWLNLSVNFTDINEEDNHTAYFCKTDSATTDGCSQTLCSSLANITGNYTSCRLNITTLSDFPLGVTIFYTFVVDNTSLISASKSNIFTIHDITIPIFKSNRTNVASVTVDTTIDIFVNVTDNSSLVNIVKAEIENPNNVKINQTMTLDSGTSSNGEWKVTFTPNIVGTHNVVFYAQDGSSNAANTGNELSFSVTAVPVTPPVGGGGGGVTIITPTNVTPMLSFGITSFSFFVIFSPSEHTKFIRVINQGTGAFENAEIIVIGDASRIIDASVCDIDKIDCRTENINLASGESAFLKLHGIIPEGTLSGIEGIVKLREVKEAGKVFELPISIDRPLLFNNLTVPIMERTGLSEAIAMLLSLGLFVGGLGLGFFIIKSFMESL